MRKHRKTSKKGYVSGIYATFIESESAIKRFLRRFLYKAEDIDEIAQETFLRAYKATEGRDIESPKAYLFQVARTLAYNELSRKSRKLTDYLEEAAEGEAGQTASLEDEYTAQKKVELYLDAISDLPPQCRRVFLMRKVQAMPYKAIAKQMGISISAVEQHLTLGNDRCRKFVEKQEQQGAAFGADRQPQGMR